MRLLLVAILVVFVGAAFTGESVSGVHNDEISPAALPQPAVPVWVEPTNVTAKAYGVIDLESGELLLAHNADTSLPIASVTKLFTAATVLQSTALADNVTITSDDVATEGRAGKLSVGEQYSAHELLFPLLLESSNDAATALERVVGSAIFAGKSLADAAGLSPENRSSISQLAVETRDLYRNFPHIFDITTLSQKIGDYTGWVNNSPVRDLPGYRGGKHGYTDAAGRTLVAVFAEPSLQGRELGYVILGSSDIRADTVALRAAIADSVQ